MTDKIILNRLNEDLKTNIEYVENMIIIAVRKKFFQYPLLVGEKDPPTAKHEKYDVSFLEMLQKYRINHFSSVIHESRQFKKFIMQVAEYEDVDFRILARFADTVSTYTNGINIGYEGQGQNKKSKYNLMCDILETFIVSKFLIDNFKDPNFTMTEESMSQIHKILSFSQNKMDTF